jgi:putative ABC transport system permease protein
MALRRALGASSIRLVRQLLAESALVGIAGAILGLVLAINGLDLLTAFAARLTPRAAEIRLDGPVLIFTVAVTILTGLVFGLIPALSAKSALASALKEGSAQTTTGAARRRLRAALVVGQVAVSFALLIGAGLMLRSLLKLQQVNPGFNPEKVLVMRLSANWSKYTTGDQYRDFYRRVLDKVGTQPGVKSAAMSNSFPLNTLTAQRGPFNRRFQIEGRPVLDNEPAIQADWRFITPDFDSVIRLPIIRGRFIGDTDDERAPRVVLITDSLARRCWSDEDPLGKKISVNQGQTWATVVGIVGNVRQYGLEKDQMDAVYQPVVQNGFANYLLIRTVLEPFSLVNQVRAAVHGIDPETAVDQTTTLEEAREESLAPPRLTATLLGIFGVLALVITAAGIAGMMALSVSQRAQEIGIRMALGATRGRVLGMVVRQGMILVLIGLSIGAIAAIVMTRMMSPLLFATQPTDPLTFLAVSILLLIAAAVSSYVPARRVTAIDPIAAVRSE